MVHVALHHHPGTPCACADTLTVRVESMGSDRLRLKYRVGGNLDALQLPARQAPVRTDGLWRGTCFEAFVRLPGTAGYVELNLSPSTAWAAYRFDDYRRGMRALAPEPPPTIACRRLADALEADVEIHLASLWLPSDADLEMGLAAVLRDHAGTCSYWALAHPAGNPDFHHPDGFVLTLSRARNPC